MLERKLYLLVVALLVGVLSEVAFYDVARAGSVADDVEAAIMCQCGCTYTLQACASAMGCTPGEEMRRVIAAQAAEGKSEGEIIAYFVSLYGETVLAAPTKKGFNLTAWITPFLALLAGAVVVYFLIRAWSRRRSAVGSMVPQRREELERYAALVDRELEREV